MVANMTTFRRSWEAACTRCGYVCDAVTSTFSGGHEPSPGDYSMCIGCGHITTFAADLTLRELTEPERREAENDDRITQALIARAVVMGKQKRKA
jgi:hypothetical protein